MSLLLLVVTGCSGARASAGQGTTADVNGIKLYYEQHGEPHGTPLVLLHGGGSSIDVTYSQILPYFAQHRRVIAVDEQNHGRSGHRDVPERFRDSAEDVATLLQQLGVQQADVLGFSNGASVALSLALAHRGLVRKLVFAGSMTKKSGVPAQFWEGMQKATFEDMPQELKDAFRKINPDEALLRDMHDKDAERMRNFVETSDEEVKSLTIPTLIVSGDRDVPTTEHAVELSRLFPDARLAILPGTHGAYFERDPELTAQLIQRFLDGKL